MRQRGLVELSLSQAPVRHALVHQHPEAFGVVTLQHMHHLMHQYVLETTRRFLRELQVQPDAHCFDIAAPPSGLHSLDAAIGAFDADWTRADSASS